MTERHRQSGYQSLETNVPIRGDQKDNEHSETLEPIDRPRVGYSKRALLPPLAVQL